MTDTANPAAKRVRDPAGTIARIVAAAREEFGAKGFDGAKIEHIARRAKVTKQLVYTYFVSKDELYAEVLKHISRETYGALLRIDFAALPPEQAIRTYAEAIYDLYHSDPGMAAVTVDQSLHAGAQIRSAPEARRLREALGQRLDDAIRRGIADGILAPRVDVEELEFITVIVVVGCVSTSGMLRRFLGQAGAEPPQSRFGRDYAAEVVLRALRS